MEYYYEERMQWFNKLHGRYQVIQGDFLSDDWCKKIDEADVIFVNNFAFGTKVRARA